MAKARVPRCDLLDGDRLGEVSGEAGGNRRDGRVSKSDAFERTKRTHSTSTPFMTASQYERIWRGRTLMRPWRQSTVLGTRMSRSVASKLKSSSLQMMTGGKRRQRSVSRGRKTPRRKETGTHWVDPFGP